MGLIRVPAMRVPPSRGQISDEQAGFGGGASPMAGSGIAPLDQVAAMSNMRVVQNQELAKRPGLRSIGTLTAGMRVYPATLLGTNYALCLDSAAAAKRISFNGNLTATATNLSNLAASYDTGLGFAQFRDASADVLYVGTFTAAHGMLKWDGNNTVTEEIAAGKVAGLSALWVYNQRLFGVKGTPPGSGFGGSTQTLYWSGLNNGDTMADVSNGGGFATIRTYGGQNLVGGFALGGSNFILHENAISVFRGTTFDDINITAGTSGVAPNIGFPMAWAAIDQIGYIVTNEGLYRVTEGGGVQAAGTPQFPDPIRTFLNSTTDDYSHIGVGRNWFILDNSRRKEVWVVINTRGGGGAITTRVFIWHTELQRFTGQGTFGFEVKYATVLWDANGLPQMVFVSAAGVLYATDFALAANQVYQDNGSNYTSSVNLRRMFSQEAPTDQKSWRSALVTMGSGAGETAATVGSATGATLSYANSSGSVADATDLKAQSVSTIQLSGQGPSIDLTVTDGGNSSTGWSVLRADVEGGSLGRRGG